MVGILIYVLTGAESHDLQRRIQGRGAKRGHAPPPRNARKWRKIDIFLYIICNFYSYKFGLYYLL